MTRTKKIIVAVAIILLLIVALPFVGNKLVKNALTQELGLLNSYGIKVVESTSDASYLKTKKHYKFRVEDEDKFIAYLNKFSNEQLPPYVKAMLKGVVVGADIEYNNLPISDDVSIDIYPLSLSTQMMQELAKEDLKFHEYFKKFLESGGVLYHLNYNILTGSFDGYLKDIKEQYVLEDKSEFKVNIFKLLYEGQGDIMAPSSLKSSLGKLELTLLKSSEEIHLTLKDFTSNAEFETKSTYSTSARLKNLSLNVENLGENVSIRTENLSMSLSSQTKDSRAEIFVKSQLQNLQLNAEGLDINASKFNYDLAVSNLDKDTLEELRLLIANRQTKAPIVLIQEIQRLSTNLLSKGLNAELSDFSVKDITLNKSQKLKGFSLNAGVLIKEDKDLASKIEKSPLSIVENLDINSSLKLSKDIYSYMGESNPILFMAKPYAIEENGLLIFNITLTNGKFRVNSKAIN